MKICMGGGNSLNKISLTTVYYDQINSSFLFCMKGGKR